MTTKDSEGDPDDRGRDVSSSCNGIVTSVLMYCLDVLIVSHVFNKFHVSPPDLRNGS